MLAGTTRGILSLLRLTESLRQIPVVIVSVEPPNESLMEQFKQNDYIQKPFDVRELLARVKKVKEDSCLSAELQLD